MPQRRSAPSKSAAGPRRRVLLAAALSVAPVALVATAPLLAPARAAAQRSGRIATPPEVAAALPAAKLQGEGRLRVLLMHIYDIRLWTGDKAVTPEDWSMPLALEIEYARTLYGQRIAERSLEEMRRQAPLGDEQAKTWLAEMSRLFPDVNAGDRLTGVLLPGEGARFFLNGKQRGDVRDTTFARLFFGIWLAPQTSEPALRETLLGRTAR